MAVGSGWVVHDGLRLHYLESNSGAEGSPLVIVPGGLGWAEDFLDLLEAFSGRRTLAVDLRGCGQSDAPESGYSLEHQASDVGAIVAAMGQPVTLMAYSVGAAPAIVYAAQHPEMLRGLVILDWPPRYPALPPQVVDSILQYMPRTKPHVARAYQQESAARDLTDVLGLITCPVLVIHGGQKGARLTAEGAETYRTLLPDVEVAVFEDSGHDLRQPDLARLVGTVEKFLSR